MRTMLQKDMHSYACEPGQTIHDFISSSLQEHLANILTPLFWHLHNRHPPPGDALKHSLPSILIAQHTIQDVLLPAPQTLRPLHRPRQPQTPRQRKLPIQSRSRPIRHRKHGHTLKVPRALDIPQVCPDSQEDLNLARVETPSSRQNVSDRSECRDEGRGGEGRE